MNPAASRRPIRHVFLVVWRLSVIGGAEQHITELALALHESGVSVTLLSQLPLPPNNEFAERLRAGGVRVVAPRSVPRLFWRLRAPRIWLHRGWKRLTSADRQRPSEAGGHRRVEDRFPGSRARLLATFTREAARTRPGLVHVHGYRMDQSWLLPWLDARGYPTVYTDHANLDSTPLSESALEPGFVRRAGGVLAVSESAARALASGLRGTHVGVARHVIRVPPATLVRRESTTVEILFVGRLVTDKGVAELLDAMDRLVALGLSVHLTLAGDGIDRPAFQARAASLGAAVTFAGVVHRLELHRLLAAADIAVLPSHLEAMPVALLEQMAARLAIVATTAGGIPEVLDHDRDALLVPPKDPDALFTALERLVRSPEERRTLGENARRRFDALHLDPGAIGAATIEMYADTAAERAARRRRILVVCNVPPYPPRSGVQLRTWSIIDRLRGEFDVAIACHTRTAEEDAAVIALQAKGVPAISGPLGRHNRGRRMAMALLHAYAPELGMWHSPVLARRIRDLIRAEAFDAVHVEETMLVPYVDAIPRALVPRRFLTLHNVRFDQMTKLAALTRRPGRKAWLRLNAMLTRRYERRVLRRFDRVFAVSERDRRLLVAGGHEQPVVVIPNGVDTRLKVLPPAPPGSGLRLLFVGHMGYLPCADAAGWFVDDILPLVREQAPDATFTIAGASPAARVRVLASEKVMVTGTVPDVTPYYAAADIVVVPLRAGGGSRLKILEAMALGRPLVSTTIGAEGLAVEDGVHCLLADGPVEIAAAVLRLHRDGGLARSLVAAARRLVQERYDWDAIAAKQAQAYREAFAERPR